MGREIRHEVVGYDVVLVRVVRGGFRSGFVLGGDDQWPFRIALADAVGGLSRDDPEPLFRAHIQAGKRGAAIGQALLQVGGHREVADLPALLEVIIQRGIAGGDWRQVGAH